jgi:hypothetical protein
MDLLLFLEHPRPPLPGSSVSVSGRRINTPACTDLDRSPIHP